MSMARAKSCPPPRSLVYGKAIDPAIGTVRSLRVLLPSLVSAFMHQL